jgi:hypothetical protein
VAVETEESLSFPGFCAICHQTVRMTTMVGLLSSTSPITQCPPCPRDLRPSTVFQSVGQVAIILFAGTSLQVVRIA